MDAMPDHAVTRRCGAVTEDDDDGPSRITGRHPITIPLPMAKSRPLPGRLLVAVAALLLVAVGMVGLGMKLVGSDGADHHPDGGEAEGPTGFYIPGDLPPDWKVLGVGEFYSEAGFSGTSPFIACPCSFTEVDQRQSDRYATIESVGGGDPSRSGSQTSTNCLSTTQ